MLYFVSNNFKNGPHVFTQVLATCTVRQGPVFRERVMNICRSDDVCKTRYGDVCMCIMQMTNSKQHAVAHLE